MQGNSKLAQSNFAPGAVDPQTFKDIEAFSKAVCEDLATRYGDSYRKPEVIYGLTAFLAAVHTAVKHLPDKPNAA